MTNPPFQGGCQCGNVRFELSVEPICVYICHCTQCQQQSASAFGISVKVLTEGLHIRSGNLKTFNFKSDTGRQKIGSFCLKCGTRISNRYEDAPEFTTLKGGTFDDRAALKPVGHLWLKSAQPWMRELVSQDNETLQYKGQPENFEDISAHWKQWRRQVDR